MRQSLGHYPTSIERDRFSLEKLEEGAKWVLALVTIGIIAAATSSIWLPLLTLPDKVR